MRHVPALAVAAPGVALALLSLVLVVTGLAGTNPLFTAPALNMSEAATLRDPATVVDLIDHGEDPYVARPIPAGMLFGRAVRLTPLEAAIAAHRPEVVDVILWRTQGAAGAAFARARCLARQIGDADVSRVIDAYATGPEDLDCAATVLP